MHVYKTISLSCLVIRPLKAGFTPQIGLVRRLAPLMRFSTMRLARTVAPQPRSDDQDFLDIQHTVTSNTSTSCLAIQLSWILSNVL